jgi:DsbC/DsbD-like thiol-disulfide interchange protein
MAREPPRRRVKRGENRKRNSKVVKAANEEGGKAKIKKEIKVEICEEIVINEIGMHDSKVVKKENDDSKKENVKNEIKMEAEDNIPKRRGRVAKAAVDEDKKKNETEARKAKVTKEKKVPRKQER